MAEETVKKHTEFVSFVAERSGFEKSRYGQRVLTGVTVAGFVLPVIAYFWFIHHYGVNVIWNDQWDDIRVIAYPTVGNLWAQHNENRIFFPNLIVLLLARTTHFNIVFEEYLSGIMLVVATGLLILAHRRRSPSTPWIHYCPVAIVMLSFVQFTNTLWGFQMAWYLVMMALALTLFLLDGPKLSWLVVTGAAATAVMGSFSSLQGLLIWPAGLLLLYCRRRPTAQVVAWISSAAATGAVYFYHFNFAANVSNDSYSSPLTHPLAVIEFFFLAIGNVVGVQVPYSPSTHDDAVLVLGIVIVAVAIWVVIAYGLRRDESSASPLGVALICFGLLFAATFTEGRFLPGWGLSAGIRYATFDLLILIGCYLALLARPRAPKKARRWDEPLLVIIRAILVGAICLQIVLGIDNGLSGGRSWHRSQLMAGDFEVKIDKLPKHLVNASFIPGFLSDLSFVRQMAQVARVRHLSLFGTSEAAHHAKEGLPGSWPPTGVAIPKYGGTLNGNAYTFASASESLGPITAGVAKVDFQFNGGALFDTTNVPDGTHLTRGITYNCAGCPSTVRVPPLPKGTSDSARLSWRKAEANYPLRRTDA